MRAFLGVCTTLFLTTIAAKLPLLNDYDKALDLAKNYDKPIVLIFTGSDWSVKSQELLKVIEGEAFEKEVGNHFIFVDADFPEVNVQRAEVIAANCSLKERFDVSEFPLLVLLDRNGQELKRMGYASSEHFGRDLKSLIMNGVSLREQVDVVDLEKASDQDIERLYAQVTALGLMGDADRLLNRCMQAGKGSSILLDRYSQMLSRGLAGAKECLSMKEQLHRTGFAGRNDLKMRLALIDFQAQSQHSPKEAERVLKESISELENRQYDQVWQLHMLLAQHLFGQNRFSEALLSARESMKQAPEEGVYEVRKLIEQITAQTDRENSSSPQ